MADELSTIADWLFKDWKSVGRVVLVGVLAYVGMLILLRVSGKRTLSKMNAFDLVVTVALGSILSTTIVSGQTRLVDGLTAVGLLILLQFILAWQSVHWPAFRKLINGEPTLLFHQGQYLNRAMRQQQITEDEILSAVRSSGMLRIEAVRAVVLETDGSLTVLEGQAVADASSLKGVAGPDGDKG